MTRAYSLDLRRRVVDAVMSGATVREAAARFGVAPSCAAKWKQRFKATGSVAPGKIGGHRRPILEGEACAFVLRRIAEKPDLTVRALAAELLEHGIKVSHNRVWICLRAKGLSSKKNRAAARAIAPLDRALSCQMEGAPTQD
jgi:transposase